MLLARVLAALALWVMVCLAMRWHCSDDDTFVEDDPDVWTGPW